MRDTVAHISSGSPRPRCVRRLSGDTPSRPRELHGKRFLLLHIPFDALVLGILVKTDGFALLVRNGDLAQNLFFEVEVLEVAPCRQKDGR